MYTKINNMKTNNIRTIQDLSDLAGGLQIVAGACNVHQITVERWRKTGIPEKYHLILADKFGVLPIDLAKINKRIRKDLY
jgi:hypothetical protein